MRYLLFWHTREDELRARTPEWRAEVAAFLARFDDDLSSRSELDWSEVLAPDSQSLLVGPGAERRDGFYNAEGKPAARVWAVQVANRDRAAELAAELAGQLDTWIEIRECYPGAQRP